MSNGILSQPTSTDINKDHRYLYYYYSTFVYLSYFSLPQQQFLSLNVHLQTGVVLNLTQILSINLKLYMNIFLIIILVINKNIFSVFCGDNRMMNISQLYCYPRLSERRKIYFYPEPIVLFKNRLTNLCDYDTYRICRTS